MSTDTTTLAPTDDLKKRCAEIIAWHRTGVLKGGALRALAEAEWPDDCGALQMAERHTENEALDFIAKWGAPAPANFPARITALLHEVKRGPWEDASGEPLQDDAAAALAWIAAPPAQEERVPLTSQECRDILEEVDHYNFAIDLIRAVEKHHGITAAQKETP